MFYLAFGYFISYVPCALLVKALSSGIMPGIAGPVGGVVVLCAAALAPLRVRARSGHRVAVASARGAAMTDFAHAVLQDAGIIPPRHRWQARPELCGGAGPVEQFS